MDAIGASWLEPLPPGEGEPVTAEVELGGIVPRVEPPLPKARSGDLYIRLEGRIYGPFTTEVMEELLQSGHLTGLELASPDLNRWTPLAYHPRIVRGPVRDFDRAHQLLTELSALPASKRDPAITQEHLPKAAIMRRPRRPPGEAGAAADDPDDPDDRGGRRR